MMVVKILLLVVICINSNVLSVPIDNGVKGYPHVTCGVQSVRVDIDTEKVFQGKVFIKGESDKKECIRSFASAPAAPLPVDPHPHDHPHTIRGETVGIDLGFGQCNMRRQRTLVPRGVEYTFTLVVSFHSIFITKVDKAYRIRCFYMESEKTVAQQLDVSMLTTHAVNEQFPMPQCRYHVRRGARDGPPLRFARVGEPAYHVWECDTPASTIYGMLVKSCFVDDGQGNKVELIDEKGCVNDNHLIPNLTYNPETLEAYTESHVFKYADKSSLYFACTITICFKEDGGCNGITPPNCGASLTTLQPASYPLPPLPLPYSRDVPLLTDNEYATNVTRDDEESSESVTEIVSEPMKKQKRDVPQSKTRTTFETDLAAQSFVVLPIEESAGDNDKELNDMLTTESSSPIPSSFTLSPYRWVSNGQSKIFTASGPCLSSSGFGMFLAFIFFLLVFSASVTILFVRSHSKALNHKINVY